MAEKAKYSYVGERYAQGSSEMELFSFCATAADIYRWGGVPSKTERFHGGFQRALSDRHKAIKRFFDDNQASPTSIVVAFRPDTLKATSLGFPSSWPADGALNHTPQFAHLEFEYDNFTEDDDLTTLRENVRALIQPRLESSEEQSSSDDSDLDNEEDNDDEEEEDETDDEEEGDISDSQELDVGHSKLKQFYDFVSDDAAVEAWLYEETARHEEIKSRIAANERVSKRDRDAVEFSPEQRLKSLLISLLRPATIVDGQHRVWGAYHSDQSPIVFSVCAIKDTSWIEQVFQFVVLNKLAKPISTSFLTGLLNTSLTNTEVKEIEDRLENIGIKNTDRKIVKYLNHDDRSPFYGMIAEAGEVAGVDNRGRLSDKGMIRLAKRWKQIRRPKQEISMFMPALGATKLMEARRKWKDYETWVPYFYAFWEAIKSKYEKDGIWEKSDDNSLLYVVTMHAMQDMFIETMAEGMAKFESHDEFGEKVAEFFEDVPGTFFQGWKATGLQSGDGPEHITEAIKALRKGQKLSTVRDESVLFRDPKKA